MSLFILIREIIYMQDTVKYARKLGVVIGENCRILTNPRSAFGSEPYLVKIGNHVEITSGVKFITHDGGCWVFRNEYPEIDRFGKITVGNNVFIGMNTIILPNVSIGNNVVVGAGSVVTKSIESNCVIAGCPAKVIKTIDKYKDSTLSRSVNTKKMTTSEKQKYLLENEIDWTV
jgi:acetyltransferase-like isoleucine patch superfamily enzyme